MLSLRPDMGNPARLEALATCLESQFGLALTSFPSGLVQRLLRSLPQDISTSDPASVRRIISACSIGETMFLRHEEHFKVLASLVAELPGAQAGRPVRVWSAGCATGEEAYSLAATLEACHSRGHEVLGSDLNPESIRRAALGVYGPWSMRGVDPDHAHWLHIAGMKIEVDARLRSYVQFNTLNLAKDAYPQDLDVIFCRNVLIYFQPDAAQRVYARLLEALAPGGLLFVGYADPLPASELKLRPEYSDHVLCYRKAAPQARPDAVRRPVAPAAPQPPADEPLHADLACARGLAGHGEFAEALAMIHHLCARYPLAVEPNILGALVADEAGDPPSALAFGRRAFFLAPHEPLTLFILASALLACGDERLASQRYSQARVALRKSGDLEGNSPVPFGSGMTRLQLQKMLDAQLHLIGIRMEPSQ